MKLLKKTLTLGLAFWIVQVSAQVNFPPKLAEQAAYCVGIYDFAAQTSDRPEGQKVSKDWAEHSMYKASNVGRLPPNTINQLADKGFEDIRREYATYYDRGRAGNSDTYLGQQITIAREIVKNAVRECESRVRSLK